MLNHLAKNILALERNPISKVRFAKTIYFVYKELVRNQLVDIKSLKFIRMPLGPVPDGFMALSDDAIKITHTPAGSGLIYESVNYHTDALFNGSNAEKNIIQKTLNILRKNSTSELVEISHKDYSWLNNKNGNRYHITDKDMANNLSLLTDTTNQDNDDRLQASLVRGMLDDIVSESTDLEYPE